MRIRFVKVAVVLVIVTVVWRGTATPREAGPANVESLIQDRYDTLRKAYAAVELDNRKDESTLDSLARVSQSLLEAELELVANDKAKRIEAYQRFVKDAVRIEERLRARYGFGIATITDVLEAKAERLTAEIQVARERAGD